MKPWQRQHLFFTALLFSIFVLSGLLAVRYDRAWDLTRDRRNELSDTSIAIVKQLKYPVHISAFTRGNPKVKALINRLLSRYQAQGSIYWTFKNPDAEIDAVRQYGIQRDGELLLTYQGQVVLVDTLNETAITRGLYTLLQGKTRHALFASGQGERDFSDSAAGYSQLKARLQQADIDVFSVDLAIAQRVPDETDVLVLAGPKHDYDRVEIKAMMDYVERGGRVLWLASQAQQSAQPALSRWLGVRFDDGILLGQGGKAYGLDDPTYVPIVPKTDEKSPVLSGIDTLLVFPQASPIRVLPTENAKQWQVETLLSVTGEWFLKSEQQIEKAASPMIVGASLTAMDARKRGKFWLLGDADFASNHYIGQGQNGDFAVNIIRQLASPDTGHIRIDSDLPPPVVISELTLAYLALSVMLGVPLLVLLLGFVVRRRSRQ